MKRVNVVFRSRNATSIRVSNTLAVLGSKVLLQEMERFLSSKTYIGIFVLRLFVGLRLLYGVIDNVLNGERMIEFAEFLNAHHFPFPLVSAALSVYVQFVGSIFILIGFKIRITSIILVFNFLVALIFVHLQINDTVEGMTPALAMLFGCLTFVFTGGEKVSVDFYLESRYN